MAIDVKCLIPCKKAKIIHSLCKQTFTIHVNSFRSNLNIALEKKKGNKND